MKNAQKLWMGVVAGLTGIVFFAACKPKTTAQKVEEKVEDAAHEAGQTVERAGERIKDATNQ